MAKDKYKDSYSTYYVDYTASKTSTAGLTQSLNRYNNSEGNLVFDELIYCKTNLAGYFFDGFMQINHTLATTITSHQVQQGVSVSDHAYMEPIEVQMTIKMSDAHQDVIYALQNQFEGVSYVRSVGAFEVLKQLMEDRTPFMIHTRLHTYYNMLITNITVQDDINSLNGLEATVTMKELIVVKEKSVKITSRTQTTASSDSGTTSASSVSTSLFRSLAGDNGILTSTIDDSDVVG